MWLYFSKSVRDFWSTSVGPEGGWGGYSRQILSEDSSMFVYAEKLFKYNFSVYICSSMILWCKNVIYHPDLIGLDSVYIL